MQALDEDLQLFSHIEDELRRTYCAMVYRLDQNVGKILKTLQEEGLEQNDVALQNLERTKSMLKELGTWEIRLPQPVFLGPPSWRIRHLDFYDAEYQLVQPE